ncbi:hypothetical protein BDV97DRAFT_168673 [Delphinella strobiligena]|nr:hypothetical protein BDV97DRAFT_168673 [Delphinella strobiligena]
MDRGCSTHSSLSMTFENLYCLVFRVSPWSSISKEISRSCLRSAWSVSAERTGCTCTPGVWLKPVKTLIRRCPMTTRAHSCSHDSGPGLLHWSGVRARRLYFFSRQRNCFPNRLDLDQLSGQKPCPIFSDLAKRNVGIVVLYSFFLANQRQPQHCGHFLRLQGDHIFGSGTILTWRGLELTLRRTVRWCLVHEYHGQACLA